MLAVRTLKKIKKNTGITNTGLIQYKNYISKEIYDNDIVTYYENTCSSKDNDCIY